MASDPNRPPAGGPSFNSQFASMNVGAQAFVPNAQAQAFVPMQGGYPPAYGNYGMPGVYGHPPMPMGMHQPMHGGNYQPHSMGPYNAHSIPGSHLPPHQQQQQQHMGMRHPSQQAPPNPHYPPSHAMHPPSYPPAQQQQQQQQHVAPVHNKHAPNLAPESTMSQSQPATTTAAQSAKLHNSSRDGRGNSPPPVDSWEDIDDEVNEPSRQQQQSSHPTPSAESAKLSSAAASESAPTKEPAATTSTTTTTTTSTTQRSAEDSSSKLEIADAATTSSSSSIGSTGSNNRKNPSPNLSKTAKTDAVASKLTAAAQPPPKTEDDKENLNVIFIGHVDAGKSTIGGHIMYLTGQVDKRTLEKYEREAREKNRETWYLSWALDTNQEERDKGKTVEVGRASFETEKKRFTILDAPGHAGFVPNMIGGAAQADVGVLVISARKGEFETGFERKGQTREHAMLAKTAGVKHLVVLINKMDDPTVQWLEERYEECKTKLTPFLKKVGFNPKTDIFFIPVSGLTGANLKKNAKDVCPWYSGPPFIAYLDSLPTVVREDTGTFRMPIADKYKDMGTLVMGKCESGAVMKGHTLLLMPNKVPVEVIQIIRVEEEVPVAYSGDNIKLRLKGVEEEDISAGFVLCDPSSPCNVSQMFEAQLAILEHKSIICAGYNAVLHIHTLIEEVQIVELKALIDRKTGKRVSKNPRFVKQDQVVIAKLQTSGVICLENYKDFSQMARFTLRDEGKTIAMGKVLKILK